MRIYGEVDLGVDAFLRFVKPLLWMERLWVEK